MQRRIDQLFVLLIIFATKIRMCRATGQEDFALGFYPIDGLDFHASDGEDFCR